MSKMKVWQNKDLSAKIEGVRRQADKVMWQAENWAATLTVAVAPGRLKGETRLGGCFPLVGA